MRFWLRRKPMPQTCTAPRRWRYKDGPAYTGVSWSGCYVGATAGGGWAEKHIVDYEPGLPGRDRDRHTASGAIAGGQAGCDYQVSKWVFGVEGSLAASGVNGKGADLANSALTWHSENPWLATLTGRIGYSVQPDTLVYAKGGAAWVKDHNILTFDGGVQSAPDTVMNGWTVGGGVEYRFTPHWSILLEYNYIDLAPKRESFTRSTDGNAFPYGVHNSMENVLAGINYRFGSSYEPLK